MTIQFIKKDKYHIDFTCNEDAKGEGLSFDLKKVLNEYMNEFSSEIKNELWDHFAVEFWFDSGKLIFFPEKKLDEIPTEYDPFPVVIVRLTSYLEKYDAFIQHDYDKFSESELLDWYLENCREVFTSVRHALSDNTLSDLMIKALNRPNIVFQFYGSSREKTYGEKIIATV
ncbi:hypothetical protein [Acinetobacter gyllenbergii]|uniref:hypothetical protein n=1 Tax=Acinetobacter gyllenbergii TaxID=134534 RepID=UPI003F555C22